MVAISWLVKKVLFTGVIATRSEIRYQRLYRWFDFFYSFTLGPISAATTIRKAHIKCR